MHPTRCNRPIAVGLVSPRLAISVGMLLFAAGLGISFLASTDLAIVTAV